MRESKITAEEDLLVERLASLFGFKRLAEILPADIYPPYLYVAAFIFLDWGIINTYVHIAGGTTHVLLRTPQTVIMGVALFLGVAGIQYFSEGYTEVVESLSPQEEDTDFTSSVIIPFRVKVVIYGIFLVGFYLHIIINLGLWNIAASEGVTNLTNWLFVFQIGYFPVMIEFALLFFAIHALLPRRIANSNISMFFYDTRNMGGFAPVGKLLKYSYYFYTTALLMYFVLTYDLLAYSSGGTMVEPGLVEALFFSTTWLIGVASIAHSMFTMHRLMATEKEQQITAVELEMKEVIENPHDIKNSKVTDKEKLEDITRRRQEIRETRVYPASFQMWSQIAISVMLPQAMNITFQIV